MRLDSLIILSRTTVYKRWKCILDPFGPTLSRTPPGQRCTLCCPHYVTSFLAETRVTVTAPRASISSFSKEASRTDDSRHCCNERNKS